MIARILTVCTGNICRSPAAEYLLRRSLEASSDWAGSVASAGTAALVNHPSDETVRRLLKTRGLDLTPHRANQVTSHHLRWAELVLVMDKHHRQQVCSMDPTARGKTFLLGHWIDAEIPDPYRRGQTVHAEVIGLIAAATERWAKRIAPMGAESHEIARAPLGALR